MSDAKLFAITGFGGGVSIGIQADTYAEFKALAVEVYGPEAGQVFARTVFDNLKVHAPDAVAVGNVASQIPVASVTTVQPTSTVGQPLPTPPTAAPQPQAAAPAAPPVDYPGDCEHGRRVYSDKPARGKPWRRWECAKPWTKESAASRCKPVNVEG